MFRSGDPHVYRTVSRVMAWGAAIGLMILAFRPADHLAASGNAVMPAGASAPHSVDGDGTVSPGDCGEPTLLHRKHQTGDQVHPLLFRAEASATECGGIGRAPRGRPMVTRSQDAAKRNPPLRL